VRLDPVYRDHLLPASDDEVEKLVFSSQYSGRFLV
jgi:hypothetical protein